MAVNDENCPPPDDANISMESVKAGAAVFGSLVFGNEFPDHSLTYSPSPLTNRRIRENVQEITSTPSKAVCNDEPKKVLNFEKPSVSPKKRKEKMPHKKEGARNEMSIISIKKGATSRCKDTKRNNSPRKRAFKIYDTSNQANLDKKESSGSSVNPAINDSRKSKEENFKEKVQSVAELREQRRKEKEEAEAFNAEAEKTRREVLELRKKLSARFRRAKVDREKKLRDEHLAKVENEIKFKSMVHVEHRQTMKEMEDRRRRISMDDRAKLRQNHREGKERLKLVSIQEEQALLEERHESSVAIKQAQSDNAEKRRQSFAFRNGDARRIRELFAQREAEKLQQEHESYELKWDGERDADEYKKEMAKKKRDSLAFRNAEGKRIRDLEAQMKEDDQHTEHESYELKWAGEHDADDYKNKIAKEKRESLAFRISEGKRIRDLEAQMNSDDKRAEHESFELKWAGERDADDYRKQMAKEKRDSFAFRNAEGKRIRDLEAQMKSVDQNAEHESYELKWASERDANEYRKELEKEKRDSFAFRNAEGKRIRDLEAQMKSDEQHAEHESYELKWAGERDADDYRREMAKDKRDSFAFRNADCKRIRDLEAQMKVGDRHAEHESYELKWAGERDADEYRKQIAKEKRDSFAFRNAEGKRTRDLEAQMKVDDQQTEHESYELKWAGERDADDYKKKMAEEKRESFAFRNAEGKRIRDLEAQMKSVDQHAEHESYELKWAGERDADEYRKEMEKEKRDSFAFRNAEGKRIRELQAQMKANDQSAEHDSYELKWAGERDADDYRKEMKEEKRDSFAFRNREAAKHRAVMNELLSLAKEKEHESYMLKWAGENDAKKYLAEQNELRRQSLAFRNAEGKRHREIDEQMRNDEILENARNEELNAACQKDVENYKAECAARDRASLCLRGKEIYSSRVQSENERQIKLMEDHESHLLDNAAWQDVNDYVEECKRRNRLSLAFRAKEKRRHFEYEKKQAELEIQQQHYDTKCTSEDARFMELAKLKEKARIALESFKRSPNCTFGPNPFATLLE